MPRAYVLSQQSHTTQAKALKNEPLLKGALGHHDPSEVIHTAVYPCACCLAAALRGFCLSFCAEPLARSTSSWDSESGLRVASADGGAHRCVAVTPHVANLSSGLPCTAPLPDPMSASPKTEAFLIAATRPAPVSERVCRTAHTRSCPLAPNLVLAFFCPVLAPPRHQVYETVRSLNAAKSRKVPIIALSDLQETSDSPCDTGHPAHLLEAEFPEGKALARVHA